MSVPLAAGAGAPVSAAKGPPRGGRYKRYHAPAPKTRFSTTGELLALAAVIAILFVLLFPRQLIERQLSTAPRATAATLAYLQLQRRAQPNDASIRRKLAIEQIRAGQLEAAQSTLRPLMASPATRDASAVIWLQLQHARYVAVPAGSPERPAALQGYRQALLDFGNRLNPSATLVVAEQARRDGLFEVAAALSQRLLEGGAAGASPATGQPLSAAAVNDDTLATRGMFGRVAGMIWGVRPLPADATASGETGAAVSVRERAFGTLLTSYLAADDPAAALRAAQRQVTRLDPARAPWPRLIQIARYAGQPAAGADFARRWLQAATAPADRWAAFNALIDAYLAAGQPRQALLAAQQQLGRIAPSPALWRLMTRLAMQAGDTDGTALYARRLVQLEPTRGP